MVRASKFDIVMLICICVVFIGAIVSACISGGNGYNLVNSVSKTDYQDYSIGWRNEYGRGYDITKLYENNGLLSASEPLYLNRAVETSGEDKTLFFRTHNVVVNVYDGDELIYKMADNGISDVPAGFDNYVSVPISGDRNSHNIKLEIYRTKSGIGSCIDNVMLGSGSDIMYSVINGSMGAVIFSVVALVLGFAFIFLGATTMREVEKSVGCVYFGIFLVLIALPLAFDTPWAYIYFGNIYFVEVFSRVCVMASLPALVMYVMTFFDVRHINVLKMLCFMSIGLFVISLVLNFTGLVPLAYMIIPTHAVIGVSALVTAIELIYYIVKVMGNRKDVSRVYYIGLVFFLVFVISDVLGYYHNNTGDSYTGLRAGLFILIVTAIALCFGDILNLVKLGVKAGKLNQVAFTDANTGLGNSAAFKSKMAELEARRINYNCIGIIQFDVNNLKIINDTKGHEMGDLLIMKAADVISKSFGEIGSCYRVGGDEFVAITTYNHAAAACEEAIDKFEELLERFNRNPNRPFDLRIAYGIAYYTSDMGYNKTLKEIHKIADERMYSKKKELKARYAKTAAEAEIR